MSRGTPEQVLKSIVDGINAGNLDALMSLYEPEAAFATQPGNLAHGLPAVRVRLRVFEFSHCPDSTPVRAFFHPYLKWLCRIAKHPTCLLKVNLASQALARVIICRMFEREHGIE
jgi:hypothetical protein